MAGQSHTAESMEAGAKQFVAKLQAAMTASGGALPLHQLEAFVAEWHTFPEIQKGLVRLSSFTGSLYQMLEIARALCMLKPAK